MKNTLCADPALLIGGQLYHQQYVMRPKPLKVREATGRYSRRTEADRGAGVRTN
jgi:hypothetical protein